MADQHQLEVLQQGPDIWNTWRQQHPTAQPDLSGAYLSGANLSSWTALWQHPSRQERCCN